MSPLLCPTGEIWAGSVGIDMKNSIHFSVRQLIMQTCFVILINAAMILGSAVPAAAQQGSKGGDWDPRDFRGIWQTSIRDITDGMLPGEEIAFTRYGAEKHKSFDLAEYSRKGCENKGRSEEHTSEL